MKNSKIKVAIQILTLVTGFNTQAVTAVSGNCKNKIINQAKKHIAEKNPNKTLHGFSEVGSDGIENQFSISYAFDNVCSREVHIEIKPLNVLRKVEQKEQKDQLCSEANECTIIRITDGRIDCG